MKKECGCEFGSMCLPECMTRANQEIRARRWKKTHGIFPKLHCVALAVHPDQIQEAEKDAATKGVATNYDSEGCPVFTTRQHRAKFLKAYGYFDKDAGYGDPAPTCTPGPTQQQIRDARREILDRAKRLGIVAKIGHDGREKHA